MLEIDLSNRPLLGVGKDAERWVPDAALVPRVERGIGADLNVLILGEPRSGKTSLLHMLERRAPEQQRRPVAFVLGSAANGIEQLLDLVGLEVRRALGEISSGPRAWGDVALPVDGEMDRVGDPARLLNQVRSLKTDEPGALILLDGLPSPEVGHSLFGRLRDELWRLPHRWVVAAPARWKSELTRPPADAFFELKFALGPLSTDQARELLFRRGLTVDDLPEETLDDLIRASGGNPYVLIQLAREAVLTPRGVKKAVNSAVLRQERAAAIGRAASMLTAEMEGRGAVSASDKELLDALGWTRSRATQVLRRLEDEGLARSYPDAAHRRQLYELVEPDG